MPRLVDHAERQAEIVRATWRIIAQRGLEATTMRGLAQELGLANGTVNHYFPNKHAILVAAFQHVFAATNRRYETATDGGEIRGLESLRLFLLEMLPIDNERRLEARIVIPFLEYAASNEEAADLFRGMMREWEERLLELLEEARTSGDVSPDVDLRATSDAILHAMTGLQATGILLPETARPARMFAMVDSLLRMLRSPVNHA